MTGYTVHTGSTEKFVEGWDRIFKRQKSRKKSSTKSASGKKAAGGKSKASKSGAKNKAKRAK